MTELGLYLDRRSASKAEIARKTGISKSRIGDLANQPSAQLKVRELYLIALAIDVDPEDLLKEICKGIRLVNKPLLLPG